MESDVRYDAGSSVDQESVAHLLADLGTRLLNGGVAGLTARIVVRRSDPDSIVWDNPSPVHISPARLEEVRVSVEFVLTNPECVVIPVPEHLRPSQSR